MSGGPSTPALADAVSNADGLVSWRTEYVTPQPVGETSTAARALTSGPIGVNLSVLRRVRRAGSPGRCREGSTLRRPER